jgi:RNA polymerase sigma factor (sigma-70 family)
MPFLATNEASAQLFIGLHRVLEDLALTYVNDREQAIDIVQDMILVMLERERTFENKASCVCYMKQIVRNKAKNYLRKTAAIELRESMNVITEETDSFDDIDSRLCLQRLLLKYPAEIREAFICHVIDGDPSRILAEQLNISPDTLRRQFSRMKQDLLRKASSLGKKTLLLLILFVPFD